MTNTKNAAPELRDRTAARESQGYRLTEIHSVRIPGVADFPVKIRIEVRYDSYEKQSFAAASVMSADRKWTHLVSTPTSEWYPTARSHASRDLVITDELGWVAASLLQRAIAVLA